MYFTFSSFWNTKILGKKVLSGLARISPFLVICPARHAHTTCQAHVRWIKIYDMQQGKRANYLNQSGIKMPGWVAPYASVGPVITKIFSKYFYCHKP